jgi:hypothetical protein
MNKELKQKHLKKVEKLQQESFMILNDISKLQTRHIDVISRIQIILSKQKHNDR